MAWMFRQWRRKYRQQEGALADDINLPSAEEGSLPLRRTFSGISLVTSCEDTSPRIQMDISWFVVCS
jgi:hypothetical protein